MVLSALETCREVKDGEMCDVTSTTWKWLTTEDNKELSYQKTESVVYSIIFISPELSEKVYYCESNFNSLILTFKTKDIFVHFCPELVIFICVQLELIILVMDLSSNNFLVESIWQFGL